MWRSRGPQARRPARPRRAATGWIRPVSPKVRLPPHGKSGRPLPQRLNSNSVAKIIKRAAAAAGLDPAAYAGHSLRAGFATQAYLNGVPELAIMRHTGHKSLDTVRKGTDSVSRSPGDPIGTIDDATDFTHRFGAARQVHGSPATKVRWKRRSVGTI